MLLVGCNIRHEMPLLHQRLLKAGKRGAKVFAINPVDFEFTFELAGKRIVAPSKLPGALAAIAHAAGAELPSRWTWMATRVRSWLPRRSRRPAAMR